MRYELGSLRDLPERECIVVGDGTVVVVRRGDRLCAFKNSCPHQQSSLHDSWVDGDEVVCSHHLLHFSLDAAEVATPAALDFVPSGIDDGIAWIDVDDRPVREILREHARTWKRTEENR